MQPGDLVCFNNRRVLHGRKSFTLNGGMRFFKVCTHSLMEARWPHGALFSKVPESFRTRKEITNIKPALLYFNFLLLR